MSRLFQRRRRKNFQSDGINSKRAIRSRVGSTSFIGRSAEVRDCIISSEQEHNSNIQRLLLDAAASITAEQLQRICESYRLLDYPEGALRLAISCAQKVDSANVALELYRSSGDVLYNVRGEESLFNSHSLNNFYRMKAKK